jgi:beta-glucosidase
MAISDILTAQNGQRGVDVTYFNDDSTNPLLTEFLDTANVFMLDKYKPGLNPSSSRLEMTTVLVPRNTGNHIVAVRCTGAYSLFVNNIEALAGPAPNITTQEFLFDPTKYESQVIMAMGAGESYTIKLVMHARDLMVGEPTPYGATLCYEEEYSEEDAISEAVELAAKSDISLIYAGRNEQHESEGFDMKSMSLPDNQISLIKAVAAASRQTVLLLHCGNPIDVSPFVQDVDAIINMHFPGQEGPGAVVDILTGRVNPSGRLPTTWFKSLESAPSFSHFPSKVADDGDIAISYAEGLAVGYRASNLVDQIRWPFGYGLSYTTFKYNDLQLRLEKSASSPTLQAMVCLTNTGKSFGKEVVQVYVCPKAPKVWRPERELKGFTKVSLLPGESKTVEITVDILSACSYWDEEQRIWTMDKGSYEVEVAGMKVEFEASSIELLQRN